MNAFMILLGAAFISSMMPALAEISLSNFSIGFPDSYLPTNNSTFNYAELNNSSSINESIKAAMLKLPLSFIENRGQSPEDVKFMVKTASQTVFFTPDKIIFRLSSGNNSSVVRMSFEDSRDRLITGEDQLPGKANFFMGNDSSKWFNNISTFGTVRYKDLYPGVDLVFNGKEGYLKHELILCPGADLSQIVLAYSGQDDLSLAKDGSLLIRTTFGNMTDSAPDCYQEINGSRVKIEGRYQLIKESRIGFEIGRYDKRYPLVIDPALIFSTYLGGSDYDNGYGIAVDSDGSAYVAGSTLSTDFPIHNPIQASNAGGYDTYVAKINAAGSALIYSTYLGGSGNDFGREIAVDNSGNVYATGYTYSGDFPIQNPIHASIAGVCDAYVTKINAAGSALVYSTYLGGSSTEDCLGIAVDSGGNAYVTGVTSSSNFPTQDPIQSSNAGGYDTYVAKINAAGSALVYSTYLGGGLSENGFDIAVDNSGNAYVTGYTQSNNFPTQNPIQESHANAGYEDVFVTKINSAGSALVYSTYLGGTNRETGYGIAVDNSGNAYITGGTASDDFPTQNPIQASHAAYEDVFVTKINAAGSALVYSTYLGGSNGYEIGQGIAVDSNGNAYVTGNVFSTNYPIQNPIQSSNAGGTDVFITKINAAGSALIYSTYLGGSNFDCGLNIAVDSSSRAYISGVTESSNFPSENSIQAANAGSTDTFIAVVSSSDPASVIVGRVWDDADYDGIQDPEEGGISEVTANLCTADGAVVATTKTGSDGRYSFLSANVASNLTGINRSAWLEFFVKFGQKFGKIFSPKDKGEDDTRDSDVDVVTGKTDVGSGSTLDAGLKEAPKPEIKEFKIENSIPDYIETGNIVFRRGDEVIFKIYADVPEDHELDIFIYAFFDDSAPKAYLFQAKQEGNSLISTGSGVYKVNWKIPYDFAAGKYYASAGIQGKNAVYPFHDIEESNPFYIIFDKKDTDACFLNDEGYIYNGYDECNPEIGAERKYKLNIFNAKLFDESIRAIDGCKSPREAANKLRAKISDTPELKWVPDPQPKYNTFDIIDAKEKPYFGQCFDYACLLTAYLRTVGIPARPITTTDFGDIELGYTYNFHCWTEAMVLEDNPSAPIDKWYVLDSSNAYCNPKTKNKCLLTDAILPSEYWALHLERPSSIVYATTSSKTIKDACGNENHDHKDIKCDHYVPSCWQGPKLSNNCQVEIKISTDRQKYILGENIPIHLRLNNSGGQNLTTPYHLTVAQYAEEMAGISILDYPINILNITEIADIPSNGSLNITHEMLFSDYRKNGHYDIKAWINETCIGSGEFDIKSGLDVTIIAPKNITINNPLDVCLSIKNILDTPVNNISIVSHISSQLDPIGPISFEIPELASGDVVNKTWSLNMSTSGGHTIGFDVFSNDTGFNRVFSVINVLDLPEIYIECRSISLFEDYKTPFKADFKVKNIGDLVATNVSAKIVLSEGATSSETMWAIGDLNGGENVTLQANISLGKPKDAFIYVLASDSAGHNASNIIYINLLSNISASIDGLNSDTGLDVNGDGKHDYLVAEVGVNVTEPGLGRVEGWLYDADGKNMTKAENSSYFFIENRSISLKFSGLDIFKHGRNGTYLIRDMKLFNVSGGLIDYAILAYSTSAYNYTDFCPIVRLTGNYSDQGNDTDSNGLLDSLTVGVEVIPNKEGYCFATADLVDGNGTQIGSSQSTAWLSANQPAIMQLNFDGKDIHANKMNGPYYLKDVYVYHTADLNHPDSAINAYTTEAYSYLDFEGYSCSISGTKFNDTNSNATRDPGEAGLSGWTIRLTRPDGTSINATTDANGGYKFENLTSGTYRVSEVRQDNWTQTYPPWLGDHIVNITDSNVTGVDFGNNYLPVPDIPYLPSGPASGIPGAEYIYSTSSTDPNGYQISYTFDWGDGTNSTTGLFDSGAVASAAHIWSSSGVYQVRAMATNSKGTSSGWSDSLNVTINAPPSAPAVPVGPTSGSPGTSYAYSTSATDPDGDQIYYTFDWGDGTNSTTGFFDSGAIASASHIWNSSEVYQVRVMATDSWGASSEWFSELEVTIEAGDIPDQIGVFRNGGLYFDANGDGYWTEGDTMGWFGATGDLPVAGDWDGNGKDEIAVFRNGGWYFDANGDGYWTEGDTTGWFGATGDLPAAGDWDGDGRDEIAVFRNGRLYFDADGDGYWSAGDTTGWFGASGDLPAAGDWNGDGRDEIAVFRNGGLYFDADGDGYWSEGDTTGWFGATGDLPAAGDWDGDGKDEIAVFRNGGWYFDADGDGYWTEDDTTGWFGAGGDRPVAGRWGLLSSLALDNDQPQLDLKEMSAEKIHQKRTALEELQEKSEGQVREIKISREASKALV